MNIYTYKFVAIPGAGSDTGRWELHLMHNDEIVEVVHYRSGESVDEAVERAKKWVAAMERYAPPS